MVPVFINPVIIEPVNIAYLRALTLFLFIDVCLQLIKEAAVIPIIFQLGFALITLEVTQSTLRSAFIFGAGMTFLVVFLLFVQNNVEFASTSDSACYMSMVLVVLLNDLASILVILSLFLRTRKLLYLATIFQRMTDLRFVLLGVVFLENLRGCVLAVSNIFV